MDPSWQVIIGGAVGALVLELVALYRYWKRTESAGESQWPALLAIVLGSTVLLAVVGFPLALASYRIKSHKGASRVALWINGLALGLVAFFIVAALLGR